MNNDVIVIGIDPAPEKGSTIFTDTEITFDGSEPIKLFHPRKLLAEELFKFIQSLKKRPGKILICWDSPLINCSTYPKYERYIEKFLSKNKKNRMT